MGAAAYPSLLRSTLTSIALGTMTMAQGAVSLPASASTRAGLRIPPSPSTPRGSSVRARPYGRPPRRCVVGPVWLPARLPVCSRQASRAVTILRTRTVNSIHCPCLRYSPTVMCPSQGPLPGSRMQRMRRGGNRSNRARSNVRFAGLQTGHFGIGEARSQNFWGCSVEDPHSCILGDKSDIRAFFMGRCRDSQECSGGTSHTKRTYRTTRTKGAYRRNREERGGGGHPLLPCHSARDLSRNPQVHVEGCPPKNS
jgi:hypothetical protein